MPAARPLPGRGVGWWLEWPDFAPEWDPAWTWSTDRVRTEFWRHAARLAIAEYGLSRAAGIDRFGFPLVEISEYTREHRRSAMGWADPDAPPLTPAHGLSRTTSFLRSRYVPGKGVWFWWIYDPRVRDSWGRILHYHATGRAKGGVVRDVLDLDPAGRLRVREALMRWWLARRHNAANLRVHELPDEGLAIPMPIGARVVAPARRAAKPAAQAGPGYTVRRARASAVGGSGGREMGAGTRYVELRRRTAPSWLRSY